MEFNEYQELARETAIYPDQHKPLGLLYTVLGLAGESGELANKVKKLLRDKNFGHTNVIDDDEIEVFRKEIGDVLWYLANICEELEIGLDHIAVLNLKKLNDRKERGVLGGSGDDR